MNAYLDYNATTPVDPRVREAMMPYWTEEFANPSSFHQMGQRARHGIEEARERIADSLAVEPGDVVFTSGGTESDNLAIKGIFESKDSERNEIFVSTVEHQAVLHAAGSLERRGARVHRVPVDAQGVADLNFLKDKISRRTALVSLMHVNNEVGSLQPIQEAAKMAHEAGALFHTDAVQSFGKLKIHAEDLGADLLSMSAHKICGPKGAGALYIRKGLKIKAMIHGGHQEKNIRPGTENVACLVGFGKAIELCEAHRQEEAQRVSDLMNRLREGLASRVQHLRWNSPAENKIYNTLNVSFLGLDGETLLMNLDLKRICVSTGSACTAGSVEPSHVLLAMGMGEKEARAAIRFSIGRFTTAEEIDAVLSELPPLVDRLRKASVNKHVG